MWKRDGERAPHKPLLLLYALARIQRGEPSAIRFGEIENDLSRLLESWGPPRRAARPQYPFWRLQSDELWNVSGGLDVGASGDPTLAELRLQTGAFPAEVEVALHSDPSLVNLIASALLEANFPSSSHEEILDQIGMPWIAITTRRPRDPAFRETILRNYRRSCGICGFNLRLDSADLGLDAAYIRWHAADGPDSPDNGIALCALHHRAFDRGAFTFDDDRQILVSKSLSGQAAEHWFDRFSGQPLQGTQEGTPSPALEYLDWHRREVFRG
jgi:putative restriction endonuclease